MKWKQYLAVMTAAAMVISGPAVPMSQVFAADAVAAEVQASDETTDEKVITLPSAGEKLSVEAEDFTLAKKEGNDYIRIAERDWASGGKIVDWFENGNAMSIKFNAPKAGIYAVTATYRSGRKDTDTPNAFEWEGTNVESGSVDVYGEEKATTTHTVTFFVKVTKEGEGTLTFKAGEKAGPQVDKFDIEQAYTLPTGDDTLTVESEDFTLVPKAGEDTSKHIHVIENTEWASGKKMVSWFENGDAMYMNFYAPAAGDYSVTATYRSGRLQNNPNEFTWEGTNVESGIVVSVLMGMILTLPISSAALGIILNLSGLAAGAATIGCCCNMVGFAVASYRENKVAGLLAQGIGTSMLQVPNIVRKPIIWIPAIVSSAVLGPVSTMLVKMTSNATGSGMGTAGFVGQIMSYQTMAPEIGGTMTMIIIVVFQIVLPAVITLAVSEFMRKKGWIKDGDMKLEL